MEQGKKRVVVIGGGLSGLAAARAVRDAAGAKGLSVALTVLERDARPGGKIHSIRDEGYLVEAGPPGFLDNKPATLALADRLELNDRKLKDNDDAKKRFIFSDGKLQRLPEDPVNFLLSELISIRGKLRLAAEFFLPQGDPDADETVSEFVRRRLGQEALEKLIDPMSAGIYAGDPSLMSIKSCFPRVVAIEQQFGGFLKGMLAMQKMAKAQGKQGPQSAGPGGSLWSFKEGASELTDTLAGTLAEGELRTGVEAVSLEKKGAGWTVKTSDGETLSADAVVVATPAYDAAKLIAPLAEDAAALMSNIPYVPAAVVGLGYPLGDIPMPLDGFGFLIPSREKRNVLGVRWDSSTFDNRAPEGRAFITLIIGGARSPELVALDDDALMALVKAEMKLTMGVEADPAFTRIIRWPRAIPQYMVGHGPNVKKIETRLAEFQTLFLGGNAYYGIGINDCTTRAEALGPLVADALAGAEG